MKAPTWELREGRAMEIWGDLEIWGDAGRSAEMAHLRHVYLKGTSGAHDDAMPRLHADGNSVQR